MLVMAGEGLLAAPGRRASLLYLTEFSRSSELAAVRDSALSTGSVMVTPLLYGKQNMGVLALANRRHGLAIHPERFRRF